MFEKKKNHFSVARVKRFVLVLFVLYHEKNIIVSVIDGEPGGSNESHVRSPGAVDESVESCRLFLFFVLFFFFSSFSSSVFGGLSMNE